MGESVIFRELIYPTPPTCDSRSIFKQSTAGLNSVLLLLDSFPYQGKKIQSLSLLYYLLIAGEGRIDRFALFPQGISAKGNTNTLILDLNSNHRFHFLRR